MLNKKYIDFIFSGIVYPYSGKKMCELGNQGIKNDIKGYKVAKDYFESKGFIHTSIDWNGKDGALKLDLSKEITDKYLINNFDYVTNAGTSEHVENQYNCFKNIHNFTTKNGIMIHILPMKGYWKNHCKYHYDFNFFNTLANINCYEIINIKTLVSDKNQKLYGVILLKLKNNKFISEKIFKEIYNE